MPVRPGFLLLFIKDRLAGLDDALLIIKGLLGMFPAEDIEIGFPEQRLGSRHVEQFCQGVIGPGEPAEPVFEIDSVGRVIQQPLQHVAFGPQFLGALRDRPLQNGVGLGQLGAHPIKGLSQMTYFVPGLDRHVRLQLPAGNLLGHEGQTPDRPRKAARQSVRRQRSHEKHHQFDTDKQVAQAVHRFIGFRLVNFCDNSPIPIAHRPVGGQDFDSPVIPH